MKKTFYRLLVVLFPSLLLAQIDPQSVEIVRDAYGVPHIYAPTDAGVAYGLAWAHAEDDFKTIQLGYLAGNNLLSNHLKTKAWLPIFWRNLLVQKNWWIKNMTATSVPPIRKLWKPMPKD